MIAAGNVVGCLLGLVNLLVPGALHPGPGRIVYAIVMVYLGFLGLALGLVRRPHQHLLTVTILSSYLTYVTIAWCVVDSWAIASPLMMLFTAVSSAALLARSAFKVACVLTVCAVTLGLASTPVASLGVLVQQIVVQSIMLVSAMCVFYWLRRRMERLLQFHAMAARTDPLTGLLNRRAAEEAADELSGGRVVVIALDLDHFKLVNDTWGHPVGDRVLQVTADALRAVAPPDAIVARVGGEEFAVLAPAPEVPESSCLAERVHSAVGAANIELGVTCSVGCLVTEAPESITPEWLWHQHSLADVALYEAKRAGRNQVRAARTPVLEGSAPLCGLRLPVPEGPSRPGLPTQRAH